MSSLNTVIAVAGALGVGGCIGSLVTYWLSIQRDEAQRKVTFRKEQLQQFYGPLLAMHKEIRARGELRVKLQQAIDAEHVQDMFVEGPEASDRHLPTIVASIQDEAETFRNVLMPRYREMIDVFREKMWLAQADTREFFPQLIEYVDIWDKILARKLPHAIAPVVGHTEKNLHPFYLHLEEIHDRLRREVG